MYADLSEHPFSPENIARESGAPDQSERAWGRWLDKAEKLIGENLACCCEWEDGCSLDFAYEAFRKGHVPASYAADTAKKKALIASVAKLKTEFFPS